MKTPHDLACAISALINSKPRSPTIAELEGVIGEHWQEAPTSCAAVAVTGKSVSLELAKRIMEIMRDEDGKPASSSRAIPMPGVAASLKPPMVAVVEPMRDSFSLGGVVYTRVVEAGCAPDAKMVTMTGVAAHLEPRTSAIAGSAPGVTLGGAGWLPQFGDNGEVAL